MSVSHIGATCTILPNDPAVSDRLSGPRLAHAMHKLCGAVRVVAPESRSPSHSPAPRP